MTGYVGAVKQSFPDTRHPDEPCIQVSSLHKKRFPAAFYENRFCHRPISSLDYHPVPTNRFPTHCLAASQNDSTVQPNVYSFYPPSQAPREFNALNFLTSKKQKPCHIIRDRAWKSFFTSLYGKDNYSIFLVNHYVGYRIRSSPAKSRYIIMISICTAFLFALDRFIIMRSPSIVYKKSPYDPPENQGLPRGSPLVKCPADRGRHVLQIPNSLTNSTNSPFPRTPIHINFTPRRRKGPIVCASPGAEISETVWNCVLSELGVSAIIFRQPVSSRASRDPWW